MTFIGQKAGALARDGFPVDPIGGLQAALGHLAQSGAIFFFIFKNSILSQAHGLCEFTISRNTKVELRLQLKGEGASHRKRGIFVPYFLTDF